MPALEIMSLNVQVQFRDVRWRVELPRSAVDKGDVNAVAEIVRQAAPPGVVLPHRLYLRSLTDAPWTLNNIAALALPNKNFIWLKEDGKCSAPYLERVTCLRAA